jgi:phosphoglycerate kinase
VSLDWHTDVPNNLQLPVDYADSSLDIGSATIQKYVEIISKAKTILWAGPMGKYEDPAYFEGSKALAVALAKVTQENGAFSVVGGGDTLACINNAGVKEKISFVSSGGSAMLKLLASGTLAGLEALN